MNIKITKTGKESLHLEPFNGFDRLLYDVVKKEKDERGYKTILAYTLWLLSAPLCSWKIGWAVYDNIAMGADAKFSPAMVPLVGLIAGFVVLAVGTGFATQLFPRARLLVGVPVFVLTLVFLFLA